MGEPLTLNDDMVLPLEVLNIINNAVAEIQKELSKSDKAEYHLDEVKMVYIYGGFDLTFRFRHNKFRLSLEPRL
jgi:hypothetical protein